MNDIHITHNRCDKKLPKSDASPCLLVTTDQIRDAISFKTKT